jgi:preprotein translocase subunit SecG
MKANAEPGSPWNCRHLRVKAGAGSDMSGQTSCWSLEGAFMQTVIIIIHLVIVLSMVAVVLLQRSEGGIGMGTGGGGGGGGGGLGGFMTGRGQANALTRATAVLAGLFFMTSLGLAIMAGYDRAPTSVFDGAAPLTAPAQPGAQPAPGGTGPGILEQLQQGQGDQPGAPQVPQSR